MSNRDELWIPELDERRWPKILIEIGVIAAVVIGAVLLGIKLKPEETNTPAEGLERLKALEEGDVSEVELAIKNMRAQWSNQEAEDETGDYISLQMQFNEASALIMGDVLAQALLDYGILDATSVVADYDASVAMPGEMLSTVFNREPWDFVMAYGLNDVALYGKNVDEFIYNYTQIIERFHAMRPNATMFMCEIPPVSSSAKEENPNFYYINTYNEAIRRMCKENGIIFIETSDLVTDYAGDGILPGYEFFTPWMERMVEIIQTNVNPNARGSGEE